jgi:soluble lytic murein transglycosylase-like protein
MNTVQAFVIKGTLVGCFLVILLCLALTAGTPQSSYAAPIPTQVDPSAPSASVKQSKIDAETVCNISPRYPQGILQWCNLITKYADEVSLSPDLIAAVMLQESGGDAMAYSHSGAVGLMQVMPRDGLAASFMCANGPCFASRPTIAELQDPEYNLAYGTRMLANLQARFGNIRDALMAYGPKDVGYYYADKVLAIYESYKGE